MARDEDDPVTHTAESASRYDTSGQTTVTGEGIKQTAIRASVWVAIAVGGLLVLGGLAVGIYFLVVHLTSKASTSSKSQASTNCTDDKLKGYVYSARCDNGDGKLSKWLDYVHAKLADPSYDDQDYWDDFANVLLSMHVQRKNPACGVDDWDCLKKDFDFLQNLSLCGLSGLSDCIGEMKLERISTVKYLSTCTSSFDSCLKGRPTSISNGDIIIGIRQAKIIAHMWRLLRGFSFNRLHAISKVENVEPEDAVSYIYLFLSQLPWFQQMAQKLNSILKQLFVDKKIFYNVTVNIPPKIKLLLDKLHKDIEVSHHRFYYRFETVYIPLSDEDQKLPQFPKAVTHQSRLSDAGARYVDLPLSVIHHCVNHSSEICNDFLLSSVVADIFKQTVRNKNCGPASLQVKCEIHIYNVLRGLPGITVGRYYWPSRLAFLKGVAKNLNGLNTYSVYDTACSDGSKQLKKDCALSYII